MTMGDIAIAVANLGKRYRRGERRDYSDLRQTMTDFVRSRWRSVTGRERRARYPDGDLWALRHVTFTIRQGDVVGILGPNGSGKSTLLKILSRITYATEGHAELHGRQSTLLDVSAGLHGELTGRENVYLNGSIIGMSSGEIRQKFHDIVEFSGLADSIDTPLKRYSSGMCLRLAFSISAHLESDIFLVDEVLSTGDAQFQQRCLNKILESIRAGRTIVYVSHDLEQLRQLCNRGIVFAAGQMLFDGSASAALACYAKYAFTPEPALSGVR